MTWTNRFRLWGGLIAVVLVMSALTLLFNQRQSQVASFTATVTAPTARVGSSYGGVLTERFVEPGQEVRVGDRLFSVVSPDVQREAAQGFRPKSNAAYEVDVPSGTITYLAVMDAQVTSVDAVAGSYLVPGSSIATLAATNPKSVVAKFDLEAVDYGRVEAGAPVTIDLADHTQLRGTVTDVGVTTDDGRAITQVRVEAPGLTDPRLANLTRAGSPVLAVMSLRDDGMLAGPTDAMMGFLTKVGLR